MDDGIKPSPTKPPLSKVWGAPHHLILGAPRRMPGSGHHPRAGDRPRTPLGARPPPFRASRHGARGPPGVVVVVAHARSSSGSTRASRRSVSLRERARRGRSSCPRLWGSSSPVWRTERELSPRRRPPAGLPRPKAERSRRWPALGVRSRRWPAGVAPLRSDAEAAVADLASQSPFPRLGRRLVSVDVAGVAFASPPPPRRTYCSRSWLGSGLG
eukprot:scaffold82626_cov55-Phaeocystis_antarctica.AAC.2